MRTALLFPLLVVCGCSGGNDVKRRSSVDLDRAATKAQSDIDNYADQLVGAGSAGSVRPSPPAGPSAVSGGTPAAAKTVVRQYFDAIASHDYIAARAFWGDGGAASGMDAAGFARSFARYASYDAVVGTPSAPDAGAGQVYITVPVVVQGTMRDGKRFALRGPVMLHRVNDGIETSSAADHDWRISRSDLKPRA